VDVQRCSELTAPPFAGQVNAFMMIAAALSLDLSRWVGILPGGTAHLLESLKIVGQSATRGTMQPY
jgi:hypothetical protein